MKTKLFMILILATSLGISSASAQTGITVETNFDVFQQGQTVMVTGNAEEKSVAIQVKDPTGISILVRTLETDSGGNFDLQFRIPQTATLGDYQVVVSTVIDNVPVINTITFEVFEKTISMGVLIIFCLVFFGKVPVNPISGNFATKSSFLLFDIDF